MEMDVERTQIVAGCLLGIDTVILCRRQKKPRERKIWVKPWMSTRETDGAFHRLQKDLSESISYPESSGLLASG